MSKTRRVTYLPRKNLIVSYHMEPEYSNSLSFPGVYKYQRDDRGRYLSHIHTAHAVYYVIPLWVDTISRGFSAAAGWDPVSWYDAVAGIRKNRDPSTPNTTYPTEGRLSGRHPLLNG